MLKTRQNEIMKNNEFPGLSGKEFLIMEMLINDGEMFGLEMVDESDGELKKGTIYVTLQRMLKKNLVNSTEEVRGGDENGIARRLHSPTNYDERVLKTQELALKYLNMGSW
jgi:DNA-binding PadR family transcriptional regulator